MSIVPESIAIALTLVLLGVTLLPLLRLEAWWVRDCDFPRLQFALLGLLVIVADLLLLDWSLWWSWVLLAAAAFCVLYQAWWIWPYTVLHKKEVASAKAGERAPYLRLMVSNVLMDNRNAAALLKIVAKHDPDILLVVETDLWWQQQLAPLETHYPYTLKCPLANKYGMHLYSKLPLEDAQIRFLIEADRPSMHAHVSLRCGARLQLHCLHPSAPSPTENDSSSQRDTELLMVGKRVAHSALPAIVTGDMNDVAWSATTRLFRKISGLLDPRVGRGMFNTFHAQHFFLRWPLDHFFHSHHFSLIKLARLPDIGSDHFPMLIELAFTPEQGDPQQGLDADPEAQAWAAEKLAS